MNNYIILKSNDGYLLQTLVNDKINEGYIPSGGICVVHIAGGSDYFYQAMVRRNLNI